MSLAWEWLCNSALPPTPTAEMSCLRHWSTNGKLCILVESQPCTPSTWPLSPTRLGIWPRDLGLSHSRPLWPFCCFQTQTCFHKQPSLTTHSSWQDSTLLNSLSFFFSFEHNHTPSEKKTVTAMQVVNYTQVQIIGAGQRPFRKRWCVWL